MRVVVIALVVLASCAQGHPAVAEQPVIRWASYTDVARGGGTRGEWRQNNSDYDYVDDATVAIDAGGTAITAWVDQARKDIFVQHYTRAGAPLLSAPVNVSRSPDVFSWLPRLALVGDDVYVLWQEIVFSGGTHGGEVLFARSRDGGRTFEAPQNLSRSRNGDGKGRISEAVWHNGSLDLAAGEDHAIYAAWTEYDGPLWLARSLDRGTTFTRPMRIDDATRPARAPSVAVNGDTVFLAWTVGDDPAADLRLATSVDRGATFTAPRIVARTPGYSDAPKLAVDRTGTLHLAWGESTGGPFDRFTVRYMRSRDGGRTFEASRVLSRTGGSSAFPMLAVDGSHVVVSWDLAASAREQPRGLELTSSSDGGETFSEPTVVAGSIDPAGGTNGSHQGHLMEKLAVRDGDIVIANSALALGRGSRAWLMRGSVGERQRVTSRQRQQLTR